MFFGFGNYNRKVRTTCMNEIQIFNHEMFGDIRVIMIDDKPYFCGNDVAKALGYVNPRKALTDHCKGVTKRDTPTSSGVQSMSYISEGDMYRLIVSSHLESAEKFESWVFDEVLPSIRKTGGYQIPQTTDGKIALLAQGHGELKQEVDSIKADLESLKNDMPILPIEADKITTAVKRRAIEVLGGKESNAYKNNKVNKKVFSSIYSNLKYNFGIRSYKSIKRCEMDKAVEIIEAYQLPFFLEQLINNENAQQRLEV